MSYSEREKQLILVTFLKANNNVRLAQNELRRNNPRMHVPCKKTFKRIYEKFQQNSNLQRKRRIVRPDVNRELDIILSVKENPNISI